MRSRRTSRSAWSTFPACSSNTARISESPWCRSVRRRRSTAAALPPAGGDRPQLQRSVVGTIRSVLLRQRSKGVAQGRRDGGHAVPESRLLHAGEADRWDRQIERAEKAALVLDGDRKTGDPLRELLAGVAEAVATGRGDLLAQPAQRRDRVWRDRL